MNECNKQLLRLCVFVAGKPHPKKLTLTATTKDPFKGRVLDWQSESCTISEILSINAGPQSEVLQRVVKEKKATAPKGTAIDESVYFSIELGKRTIDFECPDGKTMERWVVNLIRVCYQYHSFVKQTPSNAVAKK